MPVSFLTRCNPSISDVHQDLMAEAIVAMGAVVEEARPMTAASIVEEALQQASGTKIPIKCFGCAGLPNYDEKAFHLWRDCPHKGDDEV